MPNGRTIWIRVLTFGGFIGWLVGVLGFFGIDAKTLAQMMTTHYLFLLLTVASFAAFGWGIYLWWRSSHVTTKNIEEKVRQWTDAFRLPSKIMSDDKFYFVTVATLPSKLPVTIRRPKDHPSYLELRSSISTTEKQRDVFGKMSEKTRKSVLQTIYLECSRSKIESHWNKNLDFVCIHKQIPITPDLTEARFIDSLNEMNFAVAVLGITINGLLQVPP